MRRPTPTQLKIVKGNPGGRPLNKAEPKPPTGIPPCPEWFATGSYSRQMWDRVAADLDRMGVLTLVDATALEMLCIAYEEFRDADDQVAGEGLTFKRDGFIKKNPAVTVRSEAWRKVMNGLIEFGLTPAARTRVQTVPVNTENPFREFLATAD
jgi:P27 family predicted phage terminase small subunit